MIKGKKRNKKNKDEQNSSDKDPSQADQSLDEKDKIEKFSSNKEQYYGIPLSRRTALDDQPLSAEENYSVRFEYTYNQMKYNKVINADTLREDPPQSVLKNTDDFEEIYSLITRKFPTQNSVWVQYNPLASKTMKGPTCGIVALSMASQVFHEIDCPDMLVKAIEQGYTRVGEMFDALKMAKFAELNLKCEAKVISNLSSQKFEILSHICDGWPVLIPYDRNDGVLDPVLLNGHRAHWAVLNGLAFCFELTVGSKRGDIFISTTVRPSIKEKLLDYFDRESLKGKLERESREERRERREREKKWDEYTERLISTSIRPSVKERLLQDCIPRGSVKEKPSKVKSSKKKSWKNKWAKKSSKKIWGDKSWDTWGSWEDRWESWEDMSWRDKSGKSCKDKSRRSLEDKSSGDLYVLARETTSKEIYAWKIDELLKSNNNLKVCKSNRYVPFDVDLENLRDKALLLKKRE